MHNFNVGDMVVDLTNIDQWRNTELFKQDDFLYHLNKEVLMTDGTDFIVRSKYPIGYGMSLFSDDAVFSQVSGLSQDKSRVLFNLTPHRKGIGAILWADTPVSVWDQMEHEDRAVALKNAFLTYFDKIHEEIKPSIA